MVGVPDDKYGEELCAWILLKDGERATADEIVAFCEGQIARYKIPRYIRFVECLPDDRDRQGAEVPHPAKR